MEGAGPELVFRLFRGTAASYDEVVERTTLGLDSRWKRAMLRHVREPRRVLDLASGTGIVAFRIAERWPACAVLGVELQPEFCRLAALRAAALGLAVRVRFVCARAEEAPLEPAPFDHVVSSYLAKYADLAALVARVRRALGPGGRAIFHDFTMPEDPRAVRVWEESFAQALAAAEAHAPEWAPIFRELPGIIRRTSWVPDLARELAGAGFEDVAVETLAMGTAAIVAARAPLTGAWPGATLE
jgi:demethylmenaquinone methyltransferase/2-methoxy-6-polyprenyl-1,4-benzoquinol methylase